MGSPGPEDRNYILSVHIQDGKGFGPDAQAVACTALFAGEAKTTPYSVGREAHVWNVTLQWRLTLDHYRRLTSLGQKDCKVVLTAKDGDKLGWFVLDLRAAKLQHQYKKDEGALAARIEAAPCMHPCMHVWIDGSHRVDSSNSAVSRVPKTPLRRCVDASDPGRQEGGNSKRQGLGAVLRGPARERASRSAQPPQGAHSNSSRSSSNSSCSGASERLCRCPGRQWRRWGPAW